MSVHVSLLLGVTAVWGTTFPLLKYLLVSLSGVEISALRFVIAALCMAPFLLRVPRHTWLDGLLLGAVALVSYVAQAWGLEFISSNRSAFITSLNVLMVPLIGAAMGARLAPRILLCALLACAGIGLMSWDGGANLRGDIATLVCALAYAIYIIALSARASRHDLRQLAATQILVMALLACAWLFGAALVAGKPTDLLTRAAPHWWALTYLGLIATAAMLFLQAVGQRHVPADKAAVIFSMEPVFAALAAWLWLGELLNARATLGGVLVLSAVILSELKLGHLKLRFKRQPSQDS
jgi:drug/metabolite transporter (DMT)-like permease